ncbi:MAG: hypothetical protein AB7I38_05295 [Dehalococcoidia bacterium]
MTTGPRRLLAFALAAAILAGVGCGGSEDDANLGMTYELPDGWSQREDGALVTVAAESSDLDASAPAGPRLTIERLEDAEAETDVLMAALGPDRQRIAGSISVTGEPAQLEVGGASAVAITTEERREQGTLTYRHVFAGSDEVGVTYRMTFVAPTSEWADASKTFDAFLGSVRFE